MKKLNKILFCSIIASLAFVSTNKVKAYDFYNPYDDFGSTFSYEAPTSFQFSAPDFYGTTRGTIGDTSVEIYAPDFWGTTRGTVGDSSFEIYAPDFFGNQRGTYW